MDDEDLILMIIYEYSNLAIKYAKEEAEGSEWLDITKSLNKTLFKRKKPKIGKVRCLELLNKMDRIRAEDISYFSSIPFSSFVCMLLLLDLSAREYRHLYSRSKLSKYNTIKLIDDLEKIDKYKDVMRTHHRFITKLIEEI